MKIDGINVYPNVTSERVMDLVEFAMCSLENPGICIACGADADECEPDARRYKCDECGERAVYGAEELALYMF